MGFENIKFKWTFRDYQQRVLDNSSRFIKDGKINIVAAPGSGKTILGLELIRRLNAPCIILSPTTTIKQQWQDRFKEAFLDDDQNVEDYVSFDLNEIKLLNSITYQALHSTIDKVIVEENNESIDYSKIDLFKIIKDYGIKTICLDEAHHLQNEWQKALEKFIKGLDKDIKIISLTATPPYDANPIEWERYVSVCGEIDDEIFVPELVKQKTLCPHQDYILFNFPTEKEQSAFITHKQNVSSALSDISMLYFIDDLDKRITNIYNNKNDYIYEKYSSFISLYVLLNHFNKETNTSIFHKLTNTKKVKKMELSDIEKALQFLIDDPIITNEEEKEILLKILKEKALFNRRKVSLQLDDKLKRMLISSAGKLESIKTIVKSESECLKDKLRMVILTDYIRKEEIVNVAKDIDMDNISVVSIFEKIRSNYLDLDIGCLSGTLIVLPTSLKEILISDFSLTNKEFKVKEIENTKYSIYEFKNDNRYKVDLVSKLFEQGYIKVLIGTQALLGEGWDSPCINSLILASYVGSFMLSNQMRGRAIRVYKKDENKTANIWHLVTLEPKNVINEKVKMTDEDYQEIASVDYETLKRRFECFLGPNYDNGSIESGIERITYVQPPFDSENVSNINTSMLTKANKREELASVWDNNVDLNSRTLIENKVPKELKVPAFSFFNIIGLLVGVYIEFACFIILIKNFFGDHNLSFIQVLLFLFIMIEVFIQVNKLSKLIIEHTTPTQSITSLSKAILKTFKELSMIDESTKVVIKQDEEKVFTSVSLKNATVYEQNLFNKAIKELLSPMDNPRYIIIRKNFFDKYSYRHSFACPSSLDDNSEVVEVFKRNIKRSLGNVELKYAYSDEGRKMMVKCKKKSFISLNSKAINKRQKVDK